MRTIKLSIIFMLALIISIFSPEYSNANPLENGHWRKPLPQGNALNSVTYGNGTYVAVGQSDTTLTPPNGVALLKAQNFIPENLVGYIRTLAIDEMDKITGSLKGRLVQYLNTEDGELYEIEDPKRVLKIRPSEKVSLSGIKKGNKIIVDEVTLHHVDSKSGLEGNIMAGPQPETIGEQRTLVALFNYPDKPDQPFPLQEIQDKIINNADSVDHFIRENSYGKTWLNADFIDWKTLPNHSTYYSIYAEGFLSRLLNDAIITLDPIIDFRNYSRLIFIFVGTDWGGFGTIGKGIWNSPGDGNFNASVTWLSAWWSECPKSSTLSHEFGHNLGFYHASSVFGIPESLVDLTYSAGLVGSDYQDIMGCGDCPNKHFSSIWKTQAQWIGASQVQDVFTSGEYVLDQFELPSNGTKTLRIPLGKDVEGKDLYYWIEYRNNLGTFDKEDSIPIRAQLSRLYLFNEKNYDSIMFENSFFGGGSISGTVVRDLDGIGIGKVWVSVYDPSVRYNSPDEHTVNDFYVASDFDGQYKVGGLTTGNYYVYTSNSQGYVDEYYNNVKFQSSATKVRVIQGRDTSNINFCLAAERSMSKVENSEETSYSDMYMMGGSLSDSNAGMGLTKVVIDEPFHDPYRGVKVEMIEKTGTGSDSKTRLRVTLSGVNINPADTLHFDEVGIGNSSSRVVTVANNSTDPIPIGKISVGGRHLGVFNITTDNCSNKNLLPSKSCNLTLSCSPDSGGEKFGVLLVPTNDSIRPEGSITLYGKGTTPSEIVSTPTTPSGPSRGTTGKSHNYSTGAGTSNLGHSVEYQFDWKGGGSDLSNWGSATQPKAWASAGVYNVRARARCTQHVSVVSDWSNPLSVSISVPDISVTLTTYDFGNVKMKRSKTASFRVKNNGTVNLLISTSITGTDISMFMITSGGGSKTIKSVKTLTIKVTFKPTSIRSKNSILMITSNDPDTPTVEIPLSGTGQ